MCLKTCGRTEGSGAITDRNSASEENQSSDPGYWRYTLRPKSGEDMTRVAQCVNEDTLILVYQQKL